MAKVKCVKTTENSQYWLILYCQHNNIKYIENISPSQLLMLSTQH